VQKKSVLICIFALALPVHAATTVTVAQLEQFLTSSRRAKLSDFEIAERLSRVDLSEELTSKSMARILAESSPGTETRQQLEILAAVSAIERPPLAEMPDEPAPDQARQKQIITSGRHFAGTALRILPDFLAVRDTRSLNNLPVDTGKKHGKPRVMMHFASEMLREIAVRHGKEVEANEASSSRDPWRFSFGLSSWGEFGAVLGLVLGDAFDNHLRWHRWQRSESGIQLAVFGYEIPRESSHYSVDFCCYRSSGDDPTEHAFKDKPAYHGEIYIDPGSGEVLRISVEAELRESDPVSRSAIAVQYGGVVIGGKRYVCPVRSVAISEVYNADIEKIDGIGLERRVNEVEFTGYHKFGSSTRILTGAERTEQH
jgi:hypothetical protein